MKSISFTQQGGRPYQEDYLYSNPEIGLYLVCDGVGGSAKGDVASQNVVDTIRNLVEAETIIPIDEPSVQELVTAAQNSLLEKVKAEPEMEGMGTTLTLLYIHDNGATVAHIGDSRVYFVRPSASKYWRTKDHSLVQELFDSDVLKTEEVMETHPMRNRITRALQGKTGAKSVKADVQLISNLTKGDLFFLCSDGVLEPYTADSFIDILSNTTIDIEARLKEIKGDCSAKSKDNNTCILVELTNSIEELDPTTDLITWRSIPSAVENIVKEKKELEHAKVDEKEDINYFKALLYLLLILIIGYCCFNYLPSLFN